ncbi:MAG: DbpA RNA binding domain-containing protein, partial [Actinomycetaceae bacterium]
EFLSARFEDGRDPKNRGARRPRGGSDGVTYRVDVGHRDGVRPASIVGALTGESSLRGSDIGKIDIFPSFALVEVTADLDARSQEKLARAVVGGRRLNLREDSGPRGGKPGGGFKAGAGRGAPRGRGDDRRGAPSRPRQPRY